MALVQAWNTLTTTQAAALPPGEAARLARYDYLWAWEQGTVFADTTFGPAAWGESLKTALRLYRHTRLVWNPVPDLTDFWASVVYPGVLTRDGRPQKDGTPSALPFEPDVPPALVQAAAQIWWWSGMQHQKYIIPHWAAIAGNVLLDLVDDIPGRKIVIRPRWAGQVRDLVLNSAGDVLAYALEYQVDGGQGRTYLYREEVDRAQYRFFRDGAPFDYSGELHLGAAYPNRWGFVPACWVPHQPTGGAFAAPAIGAALQELLEINSLQSMLDDGVGRGMKPIFTFMTDGNIEALFSGGKRGSTADVDPDGADRESITAFKLPKDSRTGKLDPSADTAAVAAYLTQRKAEFYRHFPEVSMWESLRERNVSGIAAEILHGDTRNKAVAIRAVTDRQLEKATQMAITMAGVRLATTWQGTDARHEVFRPYTLQSFGQGALDFAIGARPLVPAAPLTEAEKAELADIRLNNLHLPAGWVYGEMGVPEDVITQAEADTAAAKEAAAATAATTPATQPFPDPLQNAVRGAFGQQAAQAQKG